MTRARDKKKLEKGKELSKLVVIPPSGRSCPPPQPFNWEGGVIATPRRELKKKWKKCKKNGKTPSVAGKCPTNDPKNDKHIFW